MGGGTWGGPGLSARGGLSPAGPGRPGAVAESKVVRRQVRRSTRGAGGSVNVAADVNLVVASGASTSSAQTVHVTQTGAAEAGTTADDGGPTAETKEDR